MMVTNYEIYQSKAQAFEKGPIPFVEADVTAGNFPDNGTTPRFIICAYFTKGTKYAKHAHRLIMSLNKHSVPYWVEGVENLGTWNANTGYKPKYILKVMQRFPNSYIVYVDCDAEFEGYPVLFNSLECPIAVHMFKRNFNTPAKRPEILSGTIFLANTPEVQNIVREWARECENSPSVWDQRSLAAVIGEDYYDLPGEYCMIYDRMSSYISKPIIVHYQASREVRKNNGIPI